MNQITETQNTSGSVAPMSQIVFNALRKSGTITWLGFPSPEEMEMLRKEKAERVALGLRMRLEDKDREREKNKQLAREIIQRNRDEQI